MENAHILTALVILIARDIKAEKKARGTTTTSDCLEEAVHMISEKHHEILRLLERNRRWTD